jgi:thioredoxin 1
VKVGKLDVDEPADRHALQRPLHPSILFFKDGKLVDTVVGAVPKPALERKIQEHL